jgi:hypothetical protein
MLRAGSGIWIELVSTGGGMTTVWKFHLPDMRSVVPMPIGSTVLSVQYQDDQLCLWARVDHNADHEMRVFGIFGTGHLIPEGSTYVGTVQEGRFVWHVFEEIP